jgi:chaperone required for assembly of F1-ATPase
MKRFYKKAVAMPAEGGFCVALDGKPIRTPGGVTVLMPHRALANALAAEWEAQADEMKPALMEINQLVNSAIDRISVNPAAMVEEIAAYAGSDLLCYRAEAPAELCTRQQEAWDPLLDWAETRFGVRFAVTTGVIPVSQNALALQRIKAVIGQDDPFQLSALRAVAGLGGSLILAMAVREARLDAATAWRIAHIDEDWQREKWGEDSEAEASRANAYRVFASAAHVLALLR